jgi:DNA-binding SARP family transcriptional activator/pimeloyl-ACP methyl ester carboxylesterase
VGVLGTLQVDVGRRMLGPADFGGRKPKQVLEILLLHRGEPVPKERLVDALWGGRPPKDPMRTLEAYVSGLRHVLGGQGDDARGVVRTEPGAYRVPADRVRLDLALFDDLVATAVGAPAGRRRSLRERALALVRGELLADEPYAEWALPLRDLYAERVVTLRLDLAQDALAEGDAARTLALAEEVLTAQPTRERAHRLAMSAAYVAGDQDRALAAYHRCRSVLRAELGVRPLPETERVFQAVLHQANLEPTPQPPARAEPRPPPVQYARHADATIAYQVLGTGSPDVVFAHAWFSHMEVGWEEPHYRGFLGRLAQGRRLLVFDRRGMGMSDPAPASVTLDERADDILAVMDAAGSQRSVLVGSCGSGPPVICVAARAPQRVLGLVLFGTFARMLAAPGYPCGMTPQFFQEFRDGIEAGWSTGRGVFRSVPSAGGDEALMEWLGRLLRLSASPAAARAILDFGATLDVRGLLPAVAVPTLVLHRLRDQWVHPDNARYLAAHIPGARLRLLGGADHWPWFGNADEVLAAVEEFVESVAPVATRPEGFPRVAGAR